MKKLFLLVAVATTITFAACSNTKTTEEAEVTTPETAEVNIEQPSIDADTTIVMDEIEADSLEEVVE